MAVESREILCFEYINTVKDLEAISETPGLYRADIIRVETHDRLCKAFGLSKEITKKYTDHLDKLNWNGSELYIALLMESRKSKEGE